MGGVAARDSGNTAHSLPAVVYEPSGQESRAGGQAKFNQCISAEAGQPESET